MPLTMPVMPKSPTPSAVICTAATAIMTPLESDYSNPGQELPNSPLVLLRWVVIEGGDGVRRGITTGCGLRLVHVVEQRCGQCFGRRGVRHSPRGADSPDG